MEDGAFQLVFFTQGRAVEQRAVEAQGHAALDVAHHQRLGLAAAGNAGLGIAAVAQGHLAVLRQVGHHVPGEHIVHQAQVPVVADDPVVVDGHAAALLAPVLQSVEGVVGVGHHVFLAGFIVYGKHAAFLVQLFAAVLFHFHSAGPSFE